MSHDAHGVGPSQQVADAALAAGARVLSAETWRPDPGQANPSLNNMLRAGFEPVYDRTNWVLRAPEGPV